MVVVKLQGGLGNQMFQYAAGMGLTNGRPIYLDHCFLEENHTDTEHFTARGYELGLFRNLKAYRASPWQLKIFHSNKLYYRSYRRFFKTRVARQADNAFIDFEEAYGRPSNIYLDGYFHSEKYFRPLRERLLADFTFPALDQHNEILRKQILSSPNPVCIHVRRGDYLKSPEVYNIHGVLDAEYYHRALTFLRNKCPDISLFVFSEDIKWAKENLNLNSGLTWHVTGNRSEESWKDMALMSFCKHHIIANSSFSWWGAWLSSRGGEVFAPAEWFNINNVKFDIHDFIPTNWQIIQR